ncbi:MAG: hypothetical protein ACJ8EY_06590 [Sphingomicrobium sp.]
MLVLEALAAFVGSLAFLALCSKGLAFHSALYAAIGFKSSSELIYSRMPNVLNAAWWALASLSSAVFSSALVTGREALLVLSLFGIVATVAYTVVRAFRLMKVAAKEVGAPWPSER